MPLSTLNAISPVDGRYRRHTEPLAPLLSEWGLIRHRVEVEIRYFIDLVELPLPQLNDFPSDKKKSLATLYEGFTEENASRIKEIESITNHDVKAVEYWIKEEMEKMGLAKWSEFVHFGLTSQDVNNTAIPLSLKRATEDVYLPILDEVICTLKSLASDWKAVPMLARTHGQAASPVRARPWRSSARPRLDAWRVRGRGACSDVARAVTWRWLTCGAVAPRRGMLAGWLAVNVFFFLQRARAPRTILRCIAQQHAARHARHRRRVPPPHHQRHRPLRERRAARRGAAASPSR